MHKYKEAINKLAFSLYDRDGDGILSILDLSWCKENFDPSTKFGQEVAVLIHEYMEKNIRPKYVKQKEIINLSAFTHLVPRCALIADLEYAFRDKFKPFDEDPS
jgi:Ca2+-binding EF-hand superfamily protein